MATVNVDKRTRASNSKAKGYYRELHEGSSDYKDIDGCSEELEVGVDNCYEVERLVEMSMIKVSPPFNHYYKLKNWSFRVLFIIWFFGRTIQRKILLGYQKLK